MHYIFKNILLAMRNLGRNRGRTMAVLAAISIGIISLAFVDGYINYSLRSLEDLIILGGTGHIQAAASPAYFDEGDNDPFPYMLQGHQNMIAGLRQWPEVRDVMAGIQFFAIWGVGEKTGTVQVRAFPTAQIRDNLKSRVILSGRELAPGETGHILVGQGVAKKMRLRPGQTVSLSALTAYGGVNTRTFSVAGIASSGLADMDAGSVFMDLAAAQDLLQTSSVPQLIIYLKDSRHTGKVLARLQSLPPAAMPRTMVFRPWNTLSPFYQQAHGSYQMVLGTARLIVLLVVLFSISGTLTLSVLERLREIGTLRAFGTTRAQCRLTLVFEGAFLGLAGGGLGSLLGLTLAMGINLLGGITMPAQPGMSAALTILFTPDAGNFIQNVLLVLAAAMAGALLPGYFASRRSPAELLRTQ